MFNSLKYCLQVVTRLNKSSHGQDLAKTDNGKHYLSSFLTRIKAENNKGNFT